MWWWWWGGWTVPGWVRPPYGRPGGDPVPVQQDRRRQRPGAGQGQQTHAALGPQHPGEVARHVALVCAKPRMKRRGQMRASVVRVCDDALRCVCVCLRE